MVPVRISAQDERTIKGAESLDELRGVKELLLQRLEQARTLRVFRKSEPKEKNVAFGWQQALEIVKEVLDGNVQVPPYPDRLWYTRISTTIRTYAMDEAYIRRLAEYAKANLRLPVKFEFLVTQHSRVLAGEWNTAKSAQPAQSKMSTAGWMKDRLPDE